MVLAKSPAVNTSDDQRLHSRAAAEYRCSPAGSISRLAKLAAGLPLSASPRWRTMHSSYVARRDRVGRASSRTVQRKSAADNEVAPKRTVAGSREGVTCLPAHGKSATCLSYRLWIRRDLDPRAATTEVLNLMTGPPSDGSVARRAASGWQLLSWRILIARWQAVRLQLCRQGGRLYGKANGPRIYLCQNHSFFRHRFLCSP